jgi:Uma2 family endonuclease
MTGGTRAHARLAARLLVALASRLPAECEAFGSDLKVQGETAVRYPDATIVCHPGEPDDTVVRPTVVFEVLSPSTAMTDRRVKPLDYAGIPSVQACVLLEQDRPRVAVLRRVRGWLEEILEGPGAVLSLPEVGVELPLSELYRP